VVVPSRADGPCAFGPDGRSPTCEFLGLEFVVSRWHGGAGVTATAPSSPEAGPLSLIAPSYTISALPERAVERERILEAVRGGQVQTVSGTDRALAELLAGGGPAGVIHFSGHGKAERVAGGRGWRFDLVLDRNARLSLAAFREMLAAGLSHGPLVFLNACDLGTAVEARGELQGWGPASVRHGARGFVGGLWPLSDVGAADFAARFYEAAVRENLPVARAVRAARQGFYRTGDPTYLAYVYYGDPSATLRLR
jgi:CHAT domain-containing protein